MKNIINFIKSLLGFENPEDSMIGLSSFKPARENKSTPRKNPTNSNKEQSLSALLTRKQFQ